MTIPYCGVTLNNYRLSFAKVSFISKDIAEVTVDNNIEVTIEMVEEFDEFLTSYDYPCLGLLINRIHIYSYTFEAKFCLYSHHKMKAIALVYYSAQCRQSTQDILDLRFMDKLNLKMFEGIDLGWQQAQQWLQQELR
jgi:hypothetical protein